MKKLIIIIINSVILLSCSLKKAPLSDDINASSNQFYYKTPENNVCFLYRKNIYSYSEFVQKYDVKSFRKVKIILGH